MSENMYEYINTPAGTKKKAKKQRAPIEYPDSLHSVQYAKFIDLICEGEIEGLADSTNPLKSIYLDDVPVMSSDGTSNFGTGVQMQQRTGTQIQSYMDGYGGVEAEEGVGTRIKYNVPVVRTINNANATSARVTIGIPSMVYQNPSTGDTSGTTVQLAIALSTWDPDLIPAWQPDTSYIIGQQVNNDGGKVYICDQAGISAASGGPTGTGTDIDDNAARWDYAPGVDVAGFGPFVNQTSGFTTFGLSPWTSETYPALTSGATPVSGNANVVVSWTGENAGGVEQTCTYKIQYRPITGPESAWTDYGTYTIKGVGQEWYSNDEFGSGSYSNPPSGSASYKIPLVTGNSTYYWYWYYPPTQGYQLRVCKLSSTIGGVSSNVANQSIGFSGTADILTSTLTVSGKTTSHYQRSYVVHLKNDPEGDATGPWQIKVSRLTADSTTQSVINETWWDSYTVITDTKLRYPNSAMVAMRLDAQQFDDIPKRGYDMRGLKVKVPTNYFPLTRRYTRNVTTGADMYPTEQVWDGNFYTVWTDNPAWCFYDIVTAPRYGLGRYIPEALIDKWNLYEIARYCDEYVPDGFGGTEPRFTCNIYLQTREEAYKVVNTMASIFRGMTYWATGNLMVSQDAPKTPASLFNRSNVIDGEFNYQGASIKTRHTVCLVSWNDPAENYESKVEYVEDPEGIALYGINQTEILAVGCTSRGQANRVGRWLIYTERMEAEVITFKAGLEGLSIYPGAVIKTTDPIRGGTNRLGGRIAVSSLQGSTSTNLINLDAPYERNTAQAGYTQIFTISVVLPNGEVETRTADNTGEGTFNYVIPTVSFSDIPQENALWVMSETGQQAELWRVVSVKEIDGTQAEISATSYREDKYNIVENGFELEPLVTSTIRTLPAKPSQGNLSDAIYTSGASILTKLQVSWQYVSNAVRYSVRYRLAEGNWVSISDTKANNVDIENVVDGGLYTVRIYSINSLGRESPEALEMTHTIIGKAKPPSDVTGFTSSVQNNRVVLEWDDITDIDRSAFCITDVGTDINTDPPGAAPAIKYDGISGTYFTLPPHAAGTHNYFIRAIDTTGNYSTIFTETSFTVNIPSTPTISSIFESNSIRLSWEDCTTDHALDYYKIQRGGSYLGDPLGVILGNTYTTALTVLVDWDTTETFWVAAKDIAGNYGVADSITINITPSDLSGVITSTVQKDKLLLSWNSATITSLPISNYEIRIGASWASASVVAVTPGTSTLIPITWLDLPSTYFWVAALDYMGVYSNSISIPVPTITAPTAPLAPYFSHSLDKLSYTLSWEPPTSHTLDINYYDLRIGTDWINNIKLATPIAPTFTFPINWNSSRVFQLRAIDVAGNEGTVLTTDSLSITPPEALTLTTSSIVGDRVQLAWSEPTSILPIDHYDIRQGGVSWATAAPLTLQKGTEYRIPIDWLGIKTFWVNSVNTNNVEGTADSYTVDITVPESPIIQYTVNKDSFAITWNVPSSSLPIVDYIIKYGSTWETAITVGNSNTNTYTVKGTWVNNRTYWIAAINSNGQEGTPGEVTIDIVPSEAPNNFKQQTIDNNVLMYWDQVQGTLPTRSYELRRGTTWEGAELIGEKSGGFTTVFETAGGLFTYWIAAIDTADNYGIPRSLTATVSQPPDYVLKDNYNSLLNGTIINGYKDDYGITLPVNSTESYEDHFTIFRVATMVLNAAGSGYAVNDIFRLDSGTSSIHATGVVTSISGGGSTGPVTGVSIVTMGRYTVVPTIIGGATIAVSGVGTGLTINTTTVGNWASPQEQVSSGFPVYVQPNLAPSIYTEVIDYGTSLSSSKITVTQTSKAIVGTVTSACKISISDSMLTAQAYSQSTTNITVTATGTWVTGDYVTIDFTSGAAPDNTYRITTGGTGSFIITSPTSTTTSGICNVIGPWTNYEDVWETYAQQFRWVKIEIVYTASLFTDLLLISGLNIRLDSKLKTITNMSNVHAAASGSYSQTSPSTVLTLTGVTGTWVAGRDVDLVFSGTTPDGIYEITTGGTNTFNITVPAATDSGTVTVDADGTPFHLTDDGTPTGDPIFLDVDAIQVSASGTTVPLIALYNFVDAPNPTVCKVLLFNTAGSRQSGTVSVTVRGF